MENGKTLGLYKVEYGQEIWSQINLFITDSETFEKYKDDYFTYTKNEDDEVEDVQMSTAKLVTEDPDFIRKFQELNIGFFDPIEEIRFREEE